MAQQRQTPFTNWAGNTYFLAQQVHQPRSVVEVQERVRQAIKLKVIGAGHSFNRIADTTVDHLSLEHLNQIVSLDPEQQTVTIEGGVRYGELAEYLHQHGFALHNLASLPHITVAGACATATHGSGERHGNLATAVRALEVVTASGDIVTFSREANPDPFTGAVVGLGALGVVTKLTLAIEPSYQMQQHVYQDLPFSQIEDHFDEIQASAYSVSLFSYWQGDMINQVWLKRRVENGDNEILPPDFYGAIAADENLHPIPGEDAIHCTEQLGRVGVWYERLPHFKLNFKASSGDELQSEYFVPRAAARSALQAIRSLQDRIAPLLYASEIRVIAADDLWMSTCYQQDCVAIHFTWKPLWEDVKQVLPLIEQQLQPMAARPHWGKMFTMAGSELQAQYAKLDDFRHLVATHDPNRKFGNAFLEDYIYA